MLPHLILVGSFALQMPQETPQRKPDVVASSVSHAPQLKKVQVTTLVGHAGEPEAKDGPRTLARLNDPHGVAVAKDGTVYVSEAGNQMLRKVTPAGVVSRLAGLPQQAGSVDGVGDQARFNLPNSLAMDRQGNLFVADLGSHTIRRISPAGAVTTIAGKPGVPGDADGPGASAQFSRPHGIAVGPDGSVYVADAFNHTIRKITPDGVVHTVAGKGMAPGAVNGRGQEARFFMPYAITVDGRGNMFVVERGNNTLRKITPDGVVTTLAGKFNVPGHSDGPGAEATFSSPRGIAIDKAGNLYVADYDSCLIRMVSSDGFVTTLAGKADEPGSTDGNGTEARFNGPHGVALDGNGRIFIADSDNHAIRVITLESK